MRVFLERFDVRVSAAYGIIAALWIVFSDTLIEFLTVRNPPLFATISLYKGLGFVVVTTLALFTVLSAEVRKRDRLERDLKRDIFERTQTLEALRQSEERFSKIFHASPIGISITSLENQQILDINGSYLEILGYQREEIIGRSVTELNLWPSEEDRHRLIEMLQAQGGVRGLEAQVRTKSGVIRDTLVSIEIINLDNQACIVAMAQDITERKWTEEALKASEIRYRRLFESAKDGILILDASTGGIVDMNPYLIDLIGYSLEEYSGKKLWEIGAFRDIAASKITFAELQDKKYVRYEDLPLETSDGRLIAVEFVSNVYWAGEREVIQCNIRDITERKQAEAALRQSEERFSTIFHESPIPISITAVRDERFVDVNTAFLMMCGYDYEEIIGHTADQLGLSLNITQGANVSDMLEQENVVHSVEMQYRTKSGQIGDALISIAVIELAGEPCIITFAHDITEHKRIEQERLEAERIRAELESEKELLQLKERFVSIVSHEFRTPLAVIMSSAELVQRYRDRMTAEKQLDHIREIIAQSGYMTGLLDDILTFNKASAGKLEFKPALLDLNAFCLSAIERIESTDRGNHPIHFVADSDLENMVLDQKLLLHIVMNLLSNAVKYSPQGGEVRLELSRRGDDMILRVSDQGIGIPPESRVRLFEPFHRGDNVGTISGTGLGLAIVKESVELHGGTIKCESEVGVGTTFTVYLPVIDRDAN